MISPKGESTLWLKGIIYFLAERLIIVIVSNKLDKVITWVDNNNKEKNCKG